MLNRFKIPHMAFARRILFFVVFILLHSLSFAQSGNGLNTEEYGYIKLSANMEEFFVIVDGNFKNFRHFTTGDSLKLSSGTHSIRIVWNNINDFERTFTIVGGKTITSKFRFQFTSNPKTSFHLIEERRNTVISTDKGSEIFINGEKTGKGFTQLLLSPGYHRLKIINEKYGSLTKVIKIEATELNSISRYNQNPDPPSLFVKLLPGGSYINNNKWGKAIFTYSALTYLAFKTVSYNADYNNNKDSFQKYNLLYQQAQTTRDAKKYRLIATSHLNKMEALDKKITYASIGLVALYALTTFDGLRKPKSGYAGPSQYVPKLSLNSNPITGQPFASLTFKKEFK